MKFFKIISHVISKAEFLLSIIAGRRLRGVMFSIIATVALYGRTEAQELIPGKSPNWPEIVNPPPQGAATDPFYNELPIARWSVVPLQAFAAKIPVGLVAFHGCGQALGNEGIEKVEFIANNGQVLTVRDPSPNPETGRWEWWAYLSPQESDGIVEVRAIVYPYNGQCSMMQGGFSEGVGYGQNVSSSEQSLVLWSNQSGSYNKNPLWVTTAGSDESGTGTEGSPYRTIGAAVLKGYNGNADFGRIILGKGSYPMHRGGSDHSLNSKGWLAIEAAPGVRPSEVFIGGNTEDGSVNTRYRLICFRNLTMDYSLGSTHTIFGPSIYYIVNVWCDGVTIIGSSPASAFRDFFANTKFVAFTSNGQNRLKWSKWSSGPVADIVVGVDVSNTSGDVFSGSSFIRDWTVTGTSILNGQHPDLWQSYGQHRNRILMDGKIVGSDTELIFLDGGMPANHDVAMVNVMLATTGGGASHISSQSRHLLLWNIELTGQPLVLYPEIGLLPSFGAFGCVFPNIGLERNTNSSSFSWTCNQFSGTGLTGTLSVVLNPSYDSSFIARKIFTIPKRTVRWDMEQKERLHPYYCGVYGTRKLNDLSKPPQNIRIVR